MPRKRVNRVFSDNMPDDLTPQRFAGSSTECSADGEMAAMLVKWKDRILHKAATNIEGHFLDSPVEDFTSEEDGFERGLRTAVDEVCKLMADPSYFGRSPQNQPSSPTRPGGQGGARLLGCPFCGGDATIERKGSARASMIIACTNCGGRMESGDVYGLTRPESWAWNRRHPNEKGQR